jgi:hypothetical protein
MQIFKYLFLATLPISLLIPSSALAKSATGVPIRGFLDESKVSGDPLLFIVDWQGKLTAHPGELFPLLAPAVWAEAFITPFETKLGPITLGNGSNGLATEIHGTTSNHSISLDWEEVVNDQGDTLGWNFVLTPFAEILPSCSANQATCEEVSALTRLRINPLQPDYVTVDRSETSVSVDGLEPIPAPLPLLGVGAAFGYSRNLRKRIKTSKAPEVMSAIG